jgi:hypothetical protein
VGGFRLRRVLRTLEGPLFVPNHPAFPLPENTGWVDLGFPPPSHGHINRRVPSRNQEQPESQAGNTVFNDVLRKQHAIRTKLWLHSKQQAGRIIGDFFNEYHRVRRSPRGRRRVRHCYLERSCPGSEHGPVREIHRPVDAAKPSRKRYNQQNRSDSTGNYGTICRMVQAVSLS